MTKLLRAFLLLLATSDDRDLARQVQYLKAENRILRGKLPRRIDITAHERQRLVKLGRRLGSALKHLISIVSPRTFARWVSGNRRTSRKATRAPGRPKTEADIRDLVLLLARENAWGYTRILGELKKLGVRRIARSTVVNILKEHGIDPGPQRGEGTWDDFLQRHAATLWACDFFSTKVWTTSGLVDYFVLFFIHIGSRRVHIAGMSPNPDRQWVAQQARNVSAVFAEEPQRPTILRRDHDGKFGPEFDAILHSDGVAIHKVGPRAPNLNAYAERWVQSVKQECLDHFIIFGETHLRYLIHEYLAHYLAERPHQAKDNQPLTGLPPPPTSPPAAVDVVCAERLGGLLKHYSRKAA